MSTPHHRLPSISVRAGTARPPAALLESLEPRQLLTAYFGQSLADYFHLPSVLLDNITPPSGAAYADFGASAAGLGDLDGDNYGDFAISAPGTLNPDGSTAVAGAVFLFSGKTGTLLRTLSDGAAGFGTSIATIGDLNGDGKTDLAVGSANFDPTTPGGTNHVGRAYVYSGADGSALLTLSGTGSSDEFGYVVIGGGDLNGDGVNDLVVGAPGAGPGGEGQVYVASGATGLAIYTFMGETAGGRFGTAISVGDVSLMPGPSAHGDGVPDVLVGAPQTSIGGPSRGAGYLFDGATGVLRRSFPGSTDGYRVGTLVLVHRSAQGDVLLLSGLRPSVYSGYPDQGFVQAFDPVWTRLETFMREVDAPFNSMGRALRHVGDLDGDGYDEIVTSGAGHADQGSGPADALWTASGMYITWPDADAVSGVFSLDAPALGDIDHDGSPDYVTRARSSGRVAVVSRFAIFQPAPADGGNDALTLVFGTPRQQWRWYVITDGTYTPMSLYPGVGPGAKVLGANNSMLLVTQKDSTLSLVRNGVATTLERAVVSVIGAGQPDYSKFIFVMVGNDGKILFRQPTSPGSLAYFDSWVFQDGVLTLIAGETVRGVNSSGAILSSRSEPDGSTTWLVHTPGGADTVLEGMRYGMSIADDGTVAGIAGSSTVPFGEHPNYGPPAVWRGGVRTLLPDDWSKGLDNYSWLWQTIRADGSGHVLMQLSYTYSLPHGVSTSGAINFVYHAASGVQRVSDVVFGGPWSLFGEGSHLTAIFTLSSGGDALVGDGVLRLIDDHAPWTGADGTSTGTDASGGSSALVAISQFGDALVLRRSTSGWTGTRVNGLGYWLSLPDATAFVPDDVQVITPRTGRTFLLINARHRTLVAQVGGPQGSGPLWARDITADSQGRVSDQQIVGRATAFVSPDGRAHFAGLNDAGDLVIFYEVPSGGSYVWAMADLTMTLRAAGQDVPAMAGAPTSFAMPWGAMNIAYVDTSGSAQIVWWAPGLPEWRIDNLSQSAGYTGVFHDTLVSYVTPWNGQNVAGTDASGNLVALWWAPGMNAWSADRLVEGTPAQLNENSLTAYVTPWGGLNIAGLDKSTGKLTAYWWTPGRPAWIVEEFTISGAPTDLALTGRLSSAVSSSGDLFIAAVTADHHLANIWFGAATNYLWTFEDVTMAV